MLLLTISLTYERTSVLKNTPLKLKPKAEITILLEIEKVKKSDKLTNTEIKNILRVGSLRTKTEANQLSRFAKIN